MLVLGEIPPPWFPLQSNTGLRIRNTARSFTVPLVAQLLIYAGIYAKQLHGTFTVADISGTQPGPFPPHKSHQDGFDADVAYDLTGEYPTEIPSPIAPAWIGVVHALAPWLDRIFMSQARIDEFNTRAPEAPIPALAPVLLVKWDGHQKHAHLRFRSPKINALPHVLPP